MIAVLLALALALQFSQRAPLTPAETLLEPAILSAIERAPVEGPAIAAVPGSNSAAGVIVLACAPGRCEAVEWAMTRLALAVAGKQIDPPARTIRAVSSTEARPPVDTKAAITIAPSTGQAWQIVRGPWSTAGIGDEVVEVFARHAVGPVSARAYERAGQPAWDGLGIPSTTLVPPADATDLDRSSFIAAASAYFLATLPNAGAEALLSHLTVGAHGRLAEDGRRAVAQMGSQQRASGEVLTMFAQAIEREQRRMRSVERYMPAPVDPMLRSRVADMQKGITAVWTSIGITSSPFVPAAERIRGRGGEDRRVPTRLADGAEPLDVAALSIGKVRSSADVAYEVLNFVDGARTISDIRDAVNAEFGGVPLPAVVEYLEAAAKAGLVILKP